MARLLGLAMVADDHRFLSLHVPPTPSSPPPPLARHPSTASNPSTAALSPAIIGTLQYPPHHSPPDEYMQSTTPSDVAKFKSVSQALNFLFPFLAPDMDQLRALVEIPTLPQLFT